MRESNPVDLSVANRALVERYGVGWWSIEKCTCDGECHYFVLRDNANHMQMIGTVADCLRHARIPVRMINNLRGA